MKLAIFALGAAIVLASQSGCQLPGCHDPCGDMGCGPVYWGDWCPVDDPCDHCGNWIGPPGDVCTVPGAQYMDGSSGLVEYDEPSYRVVPGSYRESMRSGEPTPAEAKPDATASRPSNSK